MTKNFMREIIFIYLFGFRIEQKASAKKQETVLIIRVIQKNFLDTHQKER